MAKAGIECEVVPGVTAALAAAASSRRPLTRRGGGRSVSLSTAMTREGQVTAGRSADTEVFYMAGKQLAALARRLVAAGWAPDTAVCVVSRAGWPDQLMSDHTVATLGHAAMLHAGRPSVVTVGAAAVPVMPLRGVGLSQVKGPPGNLLQAREPMAATHLALDNPQARVAGTKP